VSRKQSNAKPGGDAPIYGVASGSLGTAANLDDTQVLRTEDLHAAAATAWLDDDAPIAAPPPAPDPIPPDEPAAPAVAGAQIWRNRGVPAVAGVAALLMLLLIAGSGFMSQLDLGVRAGPAGPAATANTLLEAGPSPSAEPEKAGGKDGGRGKCHGHGHAKDCQGNGD